MDDYTDYSQVVQLPLFDSIEIPLTKGLIAIIDLIDSDIAAHIWCASSGDYPYPQRRIGNGKNGTLLFMHRIVLERMIGRSLIKPEMPDHIDGNVLNNRRNNLRLSSKSTNAQNSKRRSDNASGYKGVARIRNRWRAYIRVDNRQISLGSYGTPEEAYEAYCKAAKRYFGEFARP